MKTVLIAYDLHKLGQRYEKLRTLIHNSFPNRWYCLESTFIVVTDMTPAQVRDLCSPALDSNDELLVVGVQPSAWTTRGMADNCNSWLRNNVGP